MKLILNNYAPISNNKVQRMHWALKKAFKEEVDWLVKQATFDMQSAASPIWQPEAPLKQADIHFDIFLSTNRKFDPDNFLGGSGKWILDALKHEGIIADDSHQNVKLSCEFYKDKENPRVEVVIERLEE